MLYRFGLGPQLGLSFCVKDEEKELARMKPTRLLQWEPQVTNFIVFFIKHLTSYRAFIDSKQRESEIQSEEVKTGRETLEINVLSPVQATGLRSRKAQRQTHVIGAQRANRHSLFLVWVKLSAPPKRDGSVYFMYVSSDSSELLRFQIRFDSVVKHFKWNKYARNCNLLQLKPSTECEKYNRCGNYSVCDERKEFDFGKCSCINGFDLVNQNQSAGCKRRVPLNCSQNVREGEFRELRGIKFPEFGSVIFLSNSEACKDVCVRDCSCNAYAFFRGVEHGGQSINIRIAESELGGKGNSKVWIIFFHHSLDLLSLKSVLGFFPITGSGCSLRVGVGFSFAFRD
ncbi:hypothetical protein YC2023_033516 [Brassica napus]